MYLKKKKIDQIVAGISTFEVSGSKWNILLPGTVILLFRAVKTRLLPETLCLLPAGDVGGEIK